MEFFIFIPIIVYFFSLASGSDYTEYIYTSQNFSASNLQFVEQDGDFLLSRNGTYKASIFNSGDEKANFFLCVIHDKSKTIIWSANRSAPISNSGTMKLTEKGISIFDEAGNLKWSTPPLQSSVYALKLTEMGNLVLLDQSNGSLWESFQDPTDTIVMGQSLPIGTALTTSVLEPNLTSKNYSFVITKSDAILQWYGQLYWKLSMEPGAIINSNYVVEFMIINATGLYLMGRNGSVVVIGVALSLSNFRLANLDSTGRFSVKSFSGGVWENEFEWPSDSCQIPLICGKMGLCSSNGDTHVCSCPSRFHSSSQNKDNGCLPSDNSYSLALSCNSTDSISYFSLDYGIEYFSINFLAPVKYGMNLLDCQSLCSGNCSCFGVFHRNSSGSCFMIENRLGSVRQITTGGTDLLGYIKSLVGPSPPGLAGNTIKKQNFPLVALVLLPFTGFFLFVALCFLWWRRHKLSPTKEGKLGRSNSLSSGDLDGFYIPGLPKRFDFEEVETATDNFNTQIGSGGFGVVYKGTLPDKTLVAVKKITNLGVQGKKEFCTEIAVIGNIHHANLVNLKGFCAQGRQRLLVYEYMNRGSLDHSLFGNGPVLEWQERFDIALGTARGLAYLHRGCDQKIIHCDVKPENILLHNCFQAKISDFGLSKLLAPEQSALFTTMRGTRGYLAPEWLTNSGISEKADVYSFGMVLLELVSGRKNCVPRSQSHILDGTGSNSSDGHSSSSGLDLVYFPLFALEMHERGTYLELADSRLEGRVTGDEVEILVRIALCCVHEEPTFRPNMVTVVSMLEGGISLSNPRMESLNFLRFYGRRFAEASIIEEEDDKSDFLSCPRVNASPTSTRGSQNYFSCMSSQQVSGPR